MELKEMQMVWNQVSQKLDNQKKLTNKVILQMIEERYKKKIGSVILYELLGTLLCIAVVAFVIFNFQKLDSLELQIAGIICVIVYILMPSFSLLTIKRLQIIQIGNSSISHMMNSFHKRKKQFILAQKANIAISFLMVAATIPVAMKILRNIDIMEAIKNYGYDDFVFMLILISICSLFARWIFRRYVKIMKGAESILKEIED